MKFLRSLRFAIPLVATMCASQADAMFSCRVSPSSYLGLNGAGFVTVGVGEVGILQICSINADVEGVAAKACLGWYSALLTWRETGKTGWLYFDGANSQNGNANGCTDFHQWDIRFPYYLKAG